VKDAGRNRDTHRRCAGPANDVARLTFVYNDRGERLLDAE